MLSGTLRQEVAQFGIDVIIIEPGAVKTKWDKVALDSFEEISGNGPYAPMVRGYLKFLRSLFDDASDPCVIANIILKSIRANRPKTRYAAGTGALLGLTMHKRLPES